MTKPETIHGNRRRAAFPTLAVAVLLLGCGETVAPPDPTDPPEAPLEVDVVDNSFTPTAASVDVGSAVSWSWKGSNPHNVTFDDPTIGNSGTQSAGSFERTFDQVGEYTYFCTVHGRTVMSGSVLVGDN